MWDTSSVERCRVDRMSPEHMVVGLPACWCPPFPQIDIIGAVVIVWRAGGKIIRSVLCSIVCNNCTQWTAHTWTDLTVLWIEFCLTAHFTVLRFIFVYVYYFVSNYILHACVLCSVVTWWGGPGGIEAWSLGPLLPSVLWHCWLGHLTRKTRPRYDL